MPEPKKNPFKPGKPVDPEYFGGRNRELETFRHYLGYYIEGNPQNLAILGERGIVKTSLLRKFQQIASDEKGCLVVRRELDASVDSLSSLTLFLLEALKSEGTSYSSRKKKIASRVSSFFGNYKLGVSVLGHGFSVEKISRSVAIQDYLYKELMHIWEGVREGTGGIVFLLDEAEHLQNIQGSWSFLRSVLTRASEEDAGYMLVVSGKLTLFRGIKEIFSPVERFFTPLEIMPMTLPEVREALEKPLEQSLAVKVENRAIESVFRYSGGHPYIVQTFGLYMFEEASKKDSKSIDSKTIVEVLPKVMTRLSSQIFRDRFDKTSSLERKVLLAICEIGQDTSDVEFSPQQIKVKGEKYSIRVILSRLVEKDCLVKRERGSYSLFTPLFSEYVKGRMQEEE